MNPLPIEQQKIRDKCVHPSGTFVEFTKDKLDQSIPTYFEEIVGLYPHRLAVATREVELTYDQLNRTANRIARVILQRGERAAEPVALLFERDASVIAALLGVLKAGRFFVLLDPTVPAARLRYILEDSQAGLIVADREMLPLARQVAGARDLFDFDDLDVGLSRDNLGRVILPGAVAAIVYTSGSTGEPKGVIQTHNGYLHCVMAEHNLFHLCLEDHWAIFSSLSTGGGLKHIMKLLTGISLHRFDVRKQGLSDLAVWLRTQSITTFNIGAAIFRAFIATLREDAKFSDVRMMNLTSARVTQQEVDAYKKHFSADCILVHSLATSETHTLTSFFLDQGTSVRGNVVPVGYPVENKDIIILDDDGKAAGAGELGEIAVRSCYLSPGYWQKPELTKVKFIRVADGEEETLYRTGDLGRMAEDGCLTHLGRKDFRVRVRGFSVEVSEIESALLEHTSVREAVVSGVEDQTGEPRLVAYVVPVDSAATAEVLRSFLRETLPDYMIPSAFVMMDALPLNVGGKVDRQSIGKVPSHDDRAAQSAIQARCYHPSGTSVPFTRDEVEQSIPARFEQVVQHDPDHLAVKTANYALTYDQLNRMANRVARTLRAFAPEGVGDSPVALLCASDAPVIAALFGVLKAGACFVMLDINFPMSRLQYILKDSGSSVMLTDQQNACVAEELAGQCRVLNIDKIDPGVGDQDLGLDISPLALALVLYTSGTTGRPKGVLESHRNLLYCEWQTRERLGLCSEDRLAILSSFSTGLGLLGNLLRLVTGVSLYSYDIRERGLSGLATWLARERVTLLYVGVSTFRAVIDSLADGVTLADVRVVHLGSDQVSSRDVAAYRRHFPANCVLVNTLSSSETQAIAWFYIDHESPISSGVVPVGYAYDDKEFLLLDDDGMEVDAGAVGQIAVRDPRPFLGYWGNPEATAAKFTRDPHDSDKTVYLTGDLGRMSEDGCLTHLGRKDLRVKIRGFGVDVGEVESALRAHGAVNEAVVAGVDDERGENRLVAYVVPQDASATPGMLRNVLRETLPDHMIPSHFEIIDALPLNAGGKVDRQSLGKGKGREEPVVRDALATDRGAMVDREALPIPDWTARVADAPFVAPRNDLEVQVAAIWSDVLGVTEIGVLDNFFELGGHSLTGARIISRVLDVFQVQVPVRTFFESPTVVAIVEFITGVRTVEEVDLSPVIVPAARENSLPLSFAQQRLWFLNQLEPNNPFYNLPSALRLKGCFNGAVLVESLNEIAKRHESLRTTFSVVDGEPVQVVHTESRPIIQRVDLKGLERAVKDIEVDRLMHREAHRPFDLSQGPLFRLRLLEITAQENVLFYNMHHIISDGWSSGNLMRELSTLMKAFADGQPSPLRELPVQYADFAVWERGWLQGAVLERHLGFWREHLAGAPAVLELPSDRPRPKVETFRGERCPWRPSAELSGRLQELSQREGTTVFMTLLAAFEVLLYRLTGQGDLVVGMVTANRSRVEIERLIGFFVNLLPLRTQVEGSASFRELLNGVRRNCLAVYEHQEMPFEKIVEDQRPARDLSRAPVFQVVFDMANPVDPIDLPGLAVERLPRTLSVAQFDLVLHAAERSGGIEFAMEYSTELFDGARIERLLGTYGVLLEAIVRDPGARVAELPLLTEVERHQSLVEWNDTSREYRGVESVPGLFEAQVERTPEALAVAFEDEQLTYRELDGRANQLARYLRGLGVGPEVLVGILVERSLAMVVGLLGIMKAGGAYVPLDPDYPQERLEFMIRDSGMSVLVTQSWLGERKQAKGNRQQVVEGEAEEQRSAVSSSEPRTPNPEPLRTVHLDDWGIMAEQSETNLQSNLSRDNLAYVIYTSGSTGQPKGVQISHGSLVNFLKSMEDEPGIGRNDVLLSVTTLSFDIAGLELFLPLVSGARTVLVSREVSTDGAALQRQLDDVTVMQATPATWRLLVESDWTGRRYLRVLCGGEALAPNLARELRERGQVVWNLYGPTETTIWSTVYPVTSVAGDTAVAIGRPISNTAVYLTDGNLNPLPVGVAGALLIGGAGVARGYLNRSDLSAERFVPDPFHELAGERLYRTGDRVCRTTDGNLEFLSRTDHQVKIRGFRIEPAEIEIALVQCSQVRQAVVVARSGPTVALEPFALVAYVVREPGTSPSISQLRGFLRKKVPDYMVPQLFVFLDELPLTPNGKLDRKALPKPHETRDGLKQAYVDPGTETEKLLAGIWSEVLHLKRVGIHDNFFELGGHSLLAAQVVQRMRDRLEVEVPLRSLFESQTVADLAELIDTIRWAVETPDDAGSASTEEEMF